MDKLSLYKYLSKKPCLILRLEISGEMINWLIPNETPIEKSVKRLAIELTGSADSKKGIALCRKPSLIEKCDIKIKYFGKRKIVFNLFRSKLEPDEIVMLVPSWGLRTEKKIWVLIPV